MYCHENLPMGIGGEEALQFISCITIEVRHVVIGEINNAVGLLSGKVDERAIMFLIGNPGSGESASLKASMIPFERYIESPNSLLLRCDIISGTLLCVVLLSDSVRLKFTTPSLLHSFDLWSVSGR